MNFNWCPVEGRSDKARLRTTPPGQVLIFAVAAKKPDDAVIHSEFLVVGNDVLFAINFGNGVCPPLNCSRPEYNVRQLMVGDVWIFAVNVTGGSVNEFY